MGFNQLIEKGCIFILFMINYVVISAVKQIPMMPVENSLILAGVQSCLSFKVPSSLVTKMIELLPESSCFPLASWEFASQLISQYKKSWLKRKIANYVYFLQMGFNSLYLYQLKRVYFPSVHDKLP